MNSEVLKALFALQSWSKGREFVFVNPKTKTRIKEVKKGFGTAMKLKNVIVLGNPFRFTKDNIDQFDF